MMQQVVGGACGKSMHLCARLTCHLLGRSRLGILMIEKRKEGGDESVVVFLSVLVVKKEQQRRRYY